MSAERHSRTTSRLRLTSAIVTTVTAITILLGAVAIGHAQNSDSWKLTTGSMSVARRHATVTPLLDGRVLITGGHSPTAPNGQHGDRPYLAYGDTPARWPGPRCWRLESRHEPVDRER